MLKYGYTVFVGLLLAILLAVGIAAFYEAPEAPNASVHTPQFNVDYQAEEKAWQEYDQAKRLYGRNVAVIALVLSVTYVVVGLLVTKFFPLLTDSLILGGVFGLIYSIARGFESKDDIFRFIVVAASLGITLVIGQFKLAKIFKKNK